MAACVQFCREQPSRVQLHQWENQHMLSSFAFSALTLVIGWQEGHLACKEYGGWWRWALVSPDGVAPSRMVVVSASVNLPLHYKVQKFSSGTAHPVVPEKGP